MLYTIKDYCNKRGVTRSHVNQLVDEHKISKYTFPTYIYTDNVYVEVGTQVMLDVPPQYLPECAEEVIEAFALAKTLSEDEEIQGIIRKMLLSEVVEGLRKTNDRKYNKKHPKHNEYKTALRRFYVHCGNEVDVLNQKLSALKEEI